MHRRRADPGRDGAGCLARRPSRHAHRRRRGTGLRPGRTGQDAVVTASAIAVAPVTFATRPVTATEVLHRTCASCPPGQPVLRRLHRLLLHAARAATTSGARRARTSAAGGSATTAARGLCGTTNMRYYMDCNTLPEPSCPGGCHCGDDDCGNFKTCCIHFRYGQCNTQHRERRHDHVPARHVHHPVPDRLPGLQLLGGRGPAHVPARGGVPVTALDRDGPGRGADRARGRRDRRAGAAGVGARRAAAQPRRDPAAPARGHRRRRRSRSSRRCGGDRGRGRRAAAHPHATCPGRAAGRGPSSTSSGSTLDGAQMSISPAKTDTLVAFLSSGCLTCQTFWDGLQRRRREPLPDDARLVVVVKDREHGEPVAPARAGARRRPGRDVVAGVGGLRRHDVPVLPVRGRRQRHRALRGRRQLVGAGALAAAPTPSTTSASTRTRAWALTSPCAVVSRGWPSRWSPAVAIDLVALRRCRCWEASLRSASGAAIGDGGVTVTAYVAGSALGGVAVGAAAGSAGPLPWGRARPATRLGVLAAVAALGLAFDLRLGGLRLPTVHRQVNEDWMRALPRAGCTGWASGSSWASGVVTIVTTSAVYAMLLAAALLERLATAGALIGVHVRRARAPLAVFSGGRGTRPDQLGRVDAALRRWDGRTRRAAAGGGRARDRGAGRGGRAMSDPDAHGIAIDVPAGWEGRIFVPDVPPPAINLPILHLTNTVLTRERSSLRAGAGRARRRRPARWWRCWSSSTRWRTRACTRRRGSTSPCAATGSTRGRCSCRTRAGGTPALLLARRPGVLPLRRAGHRARCRLPVARREYGPGEPADRTARCGVIAVDRRHRSRRRRAVPRARPGGRRCGGSTSCGVRSRHWRARRCRLAGMIEHPAAGLPVGTAAPPFEGTGPDGEAFASAAVRGRRHLVVFADPDAPPVTTWSLPWWPCHATSPPSWW